MGGRRADLAAEELFAPAALSGEWGLALERCGEYLAARQRAGSPVGPGRVIAPAAVALTHRLHGRDDTEAQWHAVATKMRGDATPGAYEPVLEAIGLSDQGDPARAIDALACRRTGFYGRLFDGWSRALRSRRGARRRSGRSTRH